LSVKDKENELKKQNRKKEFLYVLKICIDENNQTKRDRETRSLQTVILTSSKSFPFGKVICGE